MSEHWKSTPKYWCKHCSTYVKDTPFEKKQHESTGKHQGNLKRFLNGIQKDHAKSEREKDKVKAEVERLSKIPGASASVTATKPTSISISASRPTKTSSNVLSAADQQRQWADLAKMGIAVPEHARQDMAIPGDWHTLSRKTVNESEQALDDKLNIGVRKRKYEGQEEEEEAGEVVVKRGWGSTTRTYPGSATVDQDLDTLLAAPAFKKKMKGKDSNVSPDLESKAGDRPVAGDEVNADQSTPNIANGTALQVKSENTESDSIDAQIGILESTPSDIESAKPEKPSEAPIPVFKKRRALHKQPQNAT